MDQDDSMLSTPSSNQDDTYEDYDDNDNDNLFPESSTTASTNTNTATANNNISSSSTSYVPPQTPANDHLNAAAPGELSPPRSTNAAGGVGTNGFASAKGGAGGGTLIDDDGDFISDDDEAIDMKGGGGEGGVVGGVGKGGGGGAGATRDEKEKPGAGWKNKKVQEEMVRAWENVVDRDFDVKVWGDPLVHKLSK